MRPHRLIYTAFLLLPCLTLWMPYNASATACAAAQNITLEQTMGIECPSFLKTGIPCPANTAGALTQCVLSGDDVPRSLVPPDPLMDSVVTSGPCPPSPDGTPSCPADQIAAKKISTKSPVNIKLTLAPFNIGSLLPQLPCGGAIPLSLSANFQMGSVKIGATTTSSSLTNTINNVLGGNGCGGSTYTLLQNKIYLISAPTTAETPVSSGTVPAANGSYMSIPAGTPVSFDISQEGNSLTLPEGGSFVSDTQELITLIPGETLIALGAGQVQLASDGEIFSFSPNNTTIVITTTAVDVPQNTPLPVDSTCQVATPQSTASQSQGVASCN